MRLSGRAEDDLAGASAPLDVPAGRGPTQRRVGAGGHRHGRAREGGGQGSDVEALGPHLDLGLLRGRERQRSLRHQPPPVALRFERLRHEVRALEVPAAAHGPGPDALHRERPRRGGERARERVVLHLQDRVGRDPADETGAGGQRLDERAVEREPHRRRRRDRRDPIDPPTQVDRRRPGHQLRPLDDQLPVFDHERGVGRLRLHARPAVPSAHDRVGDPDRDAPLPGVVHHLRVHVAQHEPGRALHVAQLEPPVLDLGPRQLRERLPRPRRQPRGRRLRRHRPARVAHHDLRPEEADVRPPPRGPGDVDLLRFEGDAFEGQARRRRGRVALPQVKLELAETQRAADRARSPLLEEHARRRAAGRRVQEGERQRDQEKEEETQTHSEPHDPAEPGPSPRTRRGLVTPRRRRAAGRRGRAAGRGIPFALRAFRVAHSSSLSGVLPDVGEWRSGRELAGPPTDSWARDIGREATGLP